jgi:hypothetical protein
VEEYNVDIFKLTKKYNKASDICDFIEISEYLKKMEKFQLIQADLEYENIKTRN